MERFAVSLPFWDQWDAEWLGLLKPWIEGKFQFQDLFIAHNEHRILPTRIMTLFIFSLTGSWNNIVEARFNIPFGALTPLLFIWILARTEKISGLKWLVIAVIIAGGSLPFSWENFLIGFQSQFYFVNFFTLSSLIIAAHFHNRHWSVWLILALSLISILTLASGLLTPLAVISIYLARAYFQRFISGNVVILMVILLVMAVSAYLTMPRVEEHYILHATNFSEFASTMLRLMGWPLRGSKLFIGVMWLPGLFFVLRLLFLRQQISKTDLLMFGCLAWTAMQIVALAYGRGHDSTHMPPRYAEVLLLGLAANSWFVLRLASIPGKPLARKAILAVVAVFFVAVFFSYIQRSVLDFRVLKEERVRRLTQTENVRNYLATKDFSTINKPGFQIPYPEPKRLQMILNDPLLQEILIIEKEHLSKK
ncbi:hypothetical protein [Dyadobacter sp. CY347]|uniref:hypothetical protein n=1 Tax=Dyadobacter sp. CY347 TaxID=2909336 RepID=UPI001F228936|nr:hypothetical protein [Dyadobacter sp. CY347]MCF2490237.1 hypothetical protein [Dyadobacter sp. CY347]